MTLVIAGVNAYGIESEEPINKRYQQKLHLKLTGANTDATLDFGHFVAGSLGTFWTAAGASAPGVVALAAFRDIWLRAAFLTAFGSEELMKRDALAVTDAQIKAFTSAASAGGSATEVYVVTGLLVADTILAVTNCVDGGGSAVGILSYGTNGAATAPDALSVVNNADPGAGQKIRVAVLRNAATVAPVAGQFTTAIYQHCPEFTFASGDAPTAWDIEFTWRLTAGHYPVEATA